MYRNSDSKTPSQLRSLARVSCRTFGTWITEGSDLVWSASTTEWLTCVSAQTTIFVANHDAERVRIGYDSSDFLLVHRRTFATPITIFLLTLSNDDAGAPNGRTGVCSGNGGSNGWLCKHLGKAITEMVGSRNTVGNVDVSHPLDRSSCTTEDRFRSRYAAHRSTTSGGS
ncbi:hypothetical protein BD309DRAFT_228318 [Dichomitus squalens]|nr:hypothetical protein BD309DRAFT_228318 [Dichomitus squalens]